MGHFVCIAEYEIGQIGKDGINRTEGELDMCKVMGENSNQTFLMLEVE